MATATVGAPAPGFELPATGNKIIKLADLRGKNVVLYFYPKASTPGCTKEGLAFTALYDDFSERDTEILGVSRDGVKAQENFKAKQGFKFDLLSDKDETVCRLYDVVRLKKMYGKESLGVERSTFLIDAEGVLRREWRKVKVDGHADLVLQAVDELG
jgi:peroxiredoxin Q/BCP